MLRRRFQRRIEMRRWTEDAPRDVLLFLWVMITHTRSFLHLRRGFYRIYGQRLRVIRSDSREIISHPVALTGCHGLFKLSCDFRPIKVHWIIVSQWTSSFTLCGCSKYNRVNRVTNEFFQHLTRVTTRLKYLWATEEIHWRHRVTNDYFIIASLSPF